MTKLNANSTISQFIIIWFGQFLSSIGSGITAFALGVYVFHLTGSATSYSMMILAAFLPALLLKPIGGTLSDRLDRKLLMIIGDAGSALGLIFIIFIFYQGVTALWPLYLGLALSSVFVALQNPAYKASVTDLVDKEFYSKASGLMQLAESSRYLISPIVAGMLLHIMEIKQLLIIDLLTFLIAILTLFWVKSNSPAKQQDTEKEHFIKDLVSGFKYAFNNKGLIWLLSITSLLTFFIGLLQALLGPMILAFTDARMLGISQTVSASGMLISSAFIGIFSRAHKEITILAVALGFAGLFFALTGVSANIIFITLFLFMFFLMLPFVNTSLDVLVRRNVDNNMQGRIWSIVSLISQAGMVVAFGAAGFLADKVFNPLLQSKGALAASVGAFIGTGPGRGIGLMFFISGIFVALTAIVIARSKRLKEFDNQQRLN